MERGIRVGVHLCIRSVFGEGIFKCHIAILTMWILDLCDNFSDLYEKVKLKM